MSVRHRLRAHPVLIDLTDPETVEMDFLTLAFVELWNVRHDSSMIHQNRS